MGFEYRRDASGIVVVTMDMDGQSANTMSPAYHDEMGATVALLEAEVGLTGVIFASAKKTFFAGGDLHGLVAAETGDAAYKAWLNEDKGFLRRLERLAVPVVAAINGAALGGGFEICLACNHRIIVDAPSAVVGLPEVTLGLLPGAGGVARLPRKVPLEVALDLLLTGRFVQPEEALSLGLVDQIVPSADALIPAALAWIKGPDATAVQPWDAVDATPAVDRDASRALIAGARDRVLKQTRGKMPAPLRILEIVEQGVDLSLDQALLLETEKFAGLLGLPETRAAISLNFFAANAIRSGKMRPEGARTKVASLAVLGETPQAMALAKAAGRKLDLHRDLSQPVEMSLCFADHAEGRASVTGTHVTHLASDLPGGEGHFGFRLPAAPAGAKLVELIAGDQTSGDTLCRAYDLFQLIGYTPIIARDVPGHFVARLQSAYLTEVATLSAAGMIGVDIDTLAYDIGMTVAPGDLPSEMALSVLPTGGADAADRLLYIQSIAALSALAEGVVGTEEECDLASVMGAGFPPHTGGAIRFIRGIGIDAFAGRALDLAERHGPRFRIDPAHWEALHRGSKAA
jgi:3-hydroxyacyl-CoA dehydrogenase/enoyl-CoA hydratase/3-hydroxybutyryl-CoA epimerase